MTSGFDGLPGDFHEPIPWIRILQPSGRICELRCPLVFDVVDIPDLETGLAEYYFDFGMRIVFGYYAIDPDETLENIALASAEIAELAVWYV